ncbi:MAG: prepilin-type N-terminal cleavage/methylation domain [Chthonomonadaceae bacterium]|nr:prepilin-type N-terminal cleavage/methylation domain [Chthonomonadaceae bacterium]
MDTRLTPRQRTQRAFTLIELLVVIAIIAILAAILFPVFGAVREQARQSGTMSNMHAVYVGARLFNEDEGHYPSVLFGYAETSNPNLALLTPPRPPQRPSLTISGNTPMSQAKEFFATNLGLATEGLNRGYLYSEQVKDYVTFTCPDNLIKDQTATTPVLYPLNSPYRPGLPVLWEGPQNGTCPTTGDRDLPDISFIGQPKLYYVMDSMDIGPALDANGNIVHDTFNKVVYELHYTPDWTRKLGTACEPADPKNGNNIDVTQLKYKNPPSDTTVMMYNTDHVNTAHSSKVLIMLLNGTVKKMDVQVAARQLPLNYK